ncbi:MAG: asparagine synthase (glutamine-hydrolyzing) [Euryarchaeota archaeon]|nr:asparagine synthase (glutamine-hydrolyzing) [Euryarchaeota archaeon]
MVVLNRVLRKVHKEQDMGHTMCGIAAVLGADVPLDAKDLVRHLMHRGPDAVSNWTDEWCSLAHARLSIVGLDNGTQPMVGYHGAVLTANCEIYNHNAIRQELIGRSWLTDSDAEAILALHEQHTSGSRTPPTAEQHRAWVSRLDGMYAFTLWDPRHRQMILARDRWGIKPLHRVESSSCLWVASEAKAFREIPGFTLRLDSHVLLERLAWEYCLDDTTLFADVKQVPQGGIEVWEISDAGEAELVSVALPSPFSFVPLPWTDGSSKEMIASLRSSVRDRLMADVDVGVVLSGGLDSSLVASLAVEASGDVERMTAWTVSESEDNPDYVAAVEVAQHLDLNHRASFIDDDGLDSAIVDLVHHGEDLDVTVAFFHPLFQEVGHSHKVALCGQGADELHAGYPRYSGPSEHGASVSTRFDILDVPESARRYDSVYVCRDLDRIQCFDLNHGQLSNFQLRLVDRHSMAHGVEVRVPFLGATHVSSAARLGGDMRRHGAGEKVALRAAATHVDLPPHIIQRPKLPAGRSTTPSLLENMLDGAEDIVESMSSLHPHLASFFSIEPETAIGLALFDALHIRGASPKSDFWDLAQEGCSR